MSKENQPDNGPKVPEEEKEKPVPQLPKIDNDPKKK